jgi:hypothetical protein
VEVAWAAVDELLDELRNVGTGSPFCRKVTDLLLAGNLTSQEKPEETSKGISRLRTKLLLFHTFRQRLLSSGRLWENFLAFRNRPSSETDALFRVENGAFPHQRLNTTSTTVDLVEGHLADDLGSVIPGNDQFSDSFTCSSSQMLTCEAS